jgi:hypothetical protein
MVGMLASVPQRQAGTAHVSLARAVLCQRQEQWDVDSQRTGPTVRVHADPNR